MTDKKMGFTIMTRLKKVFDGSSKKNKDEKGKKLKEVRPPESICPDGAPKAKKSKYFKSRKFKTNKNNILTKLTTDAIPSTSPSSSKTVTPSDVSISDPFLEINSDFQQKSIRATPTDIPDIQIENLQLTGKDAEYYNSDDDLVRRKLKGSDILKSKISPTEEKSDHDFRDRSKSNGSEKKYTYTAHQNVYNISHARNIHIGPSHVQKIILNRVDADMKKRKSSVKETETIKALMCDASPVTTDLLDVVSTHIGDIFSLGRKFGYSDGQIKQYENNFFRNQKESVFQLLKDWIQVETNEATCGRLCTNLWTIDEKDAVERLAMYVIDQQVI